MSDAFDALARGDVAELAAALEDARSRGRAAIVVSTLLCRCDLSPRRVELLGVRWRDQRQVEGVEAHELVELGLLHSYAALTLRACGPEWPRGVSPGAVAWALARVVGEV